MYLSIFFEMREEINNQDCRSVGRFGVNGRMVGGITEKADRY